MKNTALTKIHEDLGAKMMSFGGYNMPLQYTSITDEHTAVREKVGLFDVSHMGEFIVKGKEALDFVQKITSNDASKLSPGQAQYSCLPNDRGGVVDDLLVYRLFDDQCSEGEQAFMLVVNASNIEKDWNWIKAANTFDTKLIDISAKSSLLALQGPNAIQVLKKLVDIDLDNLAYYTFTKGRVGDIDNVLISNTGYTGSGGYELYFDNEHAEYLWKLLMEEGAVHGIKPAGLGARDTLRLEMGFCLYGHEIDDDTSPIAAGLGWITKTKKAVDFFSKEHFIRDRKEGTKRKLTGFIVNDRRVPRQGYELFDKEDNVIGMVTSGTMSPTLDIPIGMGFVDKSFIEEGAEIFLGIRKKRCSCSIKKVPFYKA